MTPATIFISYSRKDQEEVQELIDHLRVLQYAGLSIEPWHDNQVGAGGDWEKEITDAMERASVAIFLISVNFLNSDFISRVEVPKLRQRHETENLILFPVLAKACLWTGVPWLARLNVRPPDNKPVWGDGGSHVDEDLTAIADEVKAIIESKWREALTAAQAEKDDATIVALTEVLLKSAPRDKETLQAANKEAQRRLEIAGHREAAKTAFGRAQYEQAIAAWEKLLALDPADDEAQTERETARQRKNIRDESANAEAAAAKGEHQAALETWRRVLEMAPDDDKAKSGEEAAQRQLEVQDYRRQARDAWAQRQRYDDAIERGYRDVLMLWEKLLKLAPDDPEALESATRIRHVLALRSHLVALEEAAVKSDAVVERLIADAPELLARIRATAELPPGLVFRDGKIYCEKDGAEMVLIPGGEFLMGSPDGEGRKNERPQHPVYLDPFYMDVHPVTVAQYRQFMSETGHGEPRFWDEAKFNPSNQPVVGVTWEDAAAYCEWAGKRLPTEAEWEKASRGGFAGRRYPWGNTIDESQANYNQKEGKPTLVGRYEEPNGYGLYDIIGNVWEWCADWYDTDYYQNAPRENPSGPDSGSYHVVRGGSWFTTDASLLGCAVRSFNELSEWKFNISFRCVQSASL